MHLAIIMDGNGRWAERRGLPRSAGHHRGAHSARRVIEAAPALGVGRLTLFAFSSDNWQRPEPEVAALMDLLRTSLRRDTDRYARHGARLRFIGRRDRLPPDLRREMERAEAATREQSRLDLRIAIDYSARGEILQAARRARARPPHSLREFEGLLASAAAVDLMVRTGGEQRLSDFLLWECAYAELFFTATLWPDFGPPELAEAVQQFHRRRRRFGRLPQTRRTA